MGLLDDAIREHLELKRKHGATDEELQRKETEALGPARRDFSPAEPKAETETAESAALPSDEAARAPVEPEPRGWLDEEEPEAVVETPAPAPPEPAAPEPAPIEPAPIEPAAEAPRPPLPKEPVPTPEPEPEPPRRTSDTPTQGFDALSLDDEDAEGEDGEDVLEETPDFLQDTPEHDRLWFEQKPPRDFDFDE